MTKYNQGNVKQEDGVLFLDIPNYRYDLKTNPFVGYGANVKSIYSISRYLDVVLLHNFMHGDILVCGLRSGDYKLFKKRQQLIDHIKQTGGLPTGKKQSTDEIEALEFSPYVASHSTMSIFNYYHKSTEHIDDRPHYPVDVWLVYDFHTYDRLDRPSSAKRHWYHLKDEYSRQASLLSVLVIN